jgi:hypothetical protein
LEASETIADPEDVEEVPLPLVEAIAEDDDGALASETI